MLVVAVYSTAIAVVFSAIAVLTWYFPVFSGPNGSGRDIATIVIYCVCAGGVGGALYSMRGLKKHSAAGDYDAKYTWAYVFHPLMGAVLGAVSFFFVKGGVLLFSGATGEAGPGDPFRVRCALVSIAFLAGFASHEFLTKLKEIAVTLFATK